MKVLHLLDSVNRGGAETIALDVCRNAARFGIELTVVVTQTGSLAAEFENSGAEFIKLNRRFPIDPFLITNLRKIIKEREIKIVQGYQAVESLHLQLATAGLNVKRVMSLQGFIPGKKNRIAANYLIPKLDANILVSRGLESYLTNDLGVRNTDNFHLIYNGTDPKRLKPSNKSIKNELGLAKDTTLLGMVANFMPDETKDQITVCRALPEVFQNFENAHFIFAGRIAKGAESKFELCKEFCAKNKIDRQVHFLGARDDVPDILSELDIFVFSSLYEGLPLAVTEAMLAGVPIIVSDIEPLLEVSDNGKFAEVFPIKNDKVLGEKIVKLLGNKSHRIDLASRGRIFANEKFTIDAHLRELTKLYESLLAN